MLLVVGVVGGSCEIRGSPGSVGDDLLFVCRACVFPQRLIAFNGRPLVALTDATDRNRRRIGVPVPCTGVFVHSFVRPSVRPLAAPTYASVSSLYLGLAMWQC